MEVRVLLNNWQIYFSRDTDAKPSGPCRRGCILFFFLIPYEAFWPAHPNVWVRAHRHGAQKKAYLLVCLFLLLELIILASPRRRRRGNVSFFSYLPLSSPSPLTRMTESEALTNVQKRAFLAWKLLKNAHFSYSPHNLPRKMPHNSIRHFIFNN